MCQFGFVEVRGKLVVYELTFESWGGHDVFVATLSADPRVRFAGAQPPAAVSLLVHYLEGLRSRTVMPVYDEAGKAQLGWAHVVRRGPRERFGVEDAMGR